MELNEVKNYLRIDDDITTDDKLLTTLQAAAIDYITNATGKKYRETDTVYNMCVLQLVAHWYDNRTIICSKPGALSEIPYTVTALITHIAYSNKYPHIER